MLWDSRLAVVGSVLLMQVGTALAGPVDKPVDECKEVKKEVQSLQEPKTRKVATAYCSQLLDIQDYTYTDYVYETSTDFNLEPETFTPITVTTLPPGTITETDTVTNEYVTTTSYTTLYFGCPGYELLECLTGWESSTLPMKWLQETPTTITTTITQSPNPLPKADPTRLSKACECLSITEKTITKTEVVTVVYAPYTVTGPAETWTDYENIFLEIKTVTVETGTTHITIPETIFPIISYYTEYYPYPTVIVTSTVYPASVTPRPKPTRTPPGPTKTRCRTTRVHPPKPTKTKPPRKGGKGTKGGKGGKK